jgi:hypothetical protein
MDLLSPESSLNMRELYDNVTRRVGNWVPFQEVRNVANELSRIGAIGAVQNKSSLGYYLSAER